MRIIENGAERHDDWTVARGDEAPGAAAVILPLAAWQRHSPAVGPSPHGLLVQPDDSLVEVLAAAARSPLVAVDFPDFNDGRGYSFARRLRDAGYDGELRAVGDVLRDQAFYLARCGFSSFAPAEHVRSEDFLAALGDFSLAYQAAADQRSTVQRLRHAH